MPTSHAEDPDLALIVAVWDRLADDIRWLIEIVRTNQPTQGGASGVDERGR
jgi:hypothetical protein